MLLAFERIAILQKHVKISESLEPSSTNLTRRKQRKRRGGKSADYADGRRLEKNFIILVFFG
jgi:hypothetical protein